MAIGSHQSAKSFTDEWLTPPRVLNALGEFDLDPCAPITRPWPTAKKHLTIADNGLMHPWSGRVWLNPPYGGKIAPWMQKMAAHGNGIALVFARTETDWFEHCIWNAASAVLFLYGRLNFFLVNGSESKHNAGAPSCLVAYDRNFPCANAAVLSAAAQKLNGRFVRLDQELPAPMVLENRNA